MASPIRPVLLKVLEKAPTSLTVQEILVEIKNITGKEYSEALIRTTLADLAFECACTRTKEERPVTTVSVVDTFALTPDALDKVRNGTLT